MDRRILIFLAAAVLLLGGCTPIEVSTPTATPKVAHKQAKATQTPTLTKKAKKKLTAALTPQKSTTPSVTPTATRTPVPSPTWLADKRTLTPRPTLASERARAKVNYLLLEDPECMLPCWLGVIPGETTWKEAFLSLLPFAHEIVTLQENRVAVRYELEEDIQKYPSEELPSLSVKIDFIENIAAFIDLDLFGAEERYTWKKMFAAYGKPDEIWLNARLHRKWKAKLHLYYADLGLQLAFTTVLAEDLPEDEKMLQFCFPQYPAEASVWDPELGYSFEELTGTKYLYYPLSIATSSSVIQFYITNLDNDQPCIRTSRENWGEPVKLYP